jgi:hypothetical protein
MMRICSLSLLGASEEMILHPHEGSPSLVAATKGRPEIERISFLYRIRNN